MTDTIGGTAIGEGEEEDSGGTAVGIDGTPSYQPLTSLKHIVYGTGSVLSLMAIAWEGLINWLSG